MTMSISRTARGGTLILGGGFGGAHVARLLGKAGATIVNPEATMLYTPLLPEVAAGAIEPRHAIVPLRRICPHAELIRGRAVALDATARCVTVETEFGALVIEYQRLVIALGSTARMLPIPGLAQHALTFKSLPDAIGLRNHVLRRLELADADPANARRYVTFVFVGAGYAGVEALAEVRQLVCDVWPRYPNLQKLQPHWVLVDGGHRVLAAVPGRLGDSARRRLERDGVDIRLATRLAYAEPHAVVLSDGTRIETDTLVWTAGVTAAPLAGALGLPVDGGGRLVVGPNLRVDGHPDIWAMGDCAAVPNAATGWLDPPTCQHALRQARRIVKSLRGDPRPYRYRSHGQGATLGRLKGIAYVFGVSVCGIPAAVIVRWYHMAQVPQLSRAVRILADSGLSLVFGRDYAEVPSAEPALHDKVRADGAAQAWTADEVRMPRVLHR